MKRIYRDGIKGKIAGVCSGFGNYFNINPSAIRVFWLFMSLVAGFGIGFYIFFMIFLTDEIYNQ